MLVHHETLVQYFQGQSSVSPHCFIKSFWFWTLLIVLENTYIKQMAQKWMLPFLYYRNKSFFSHTILLVFAYTLQRSHVFYSPLEIFDFLKLVTFFGGGGVHPILLWIVQPRNFAPQNCIFDIWTFWHFWKIQHSFIMWQKCMGGKKSGWQNVLFWMGWQNVLVVQCLVAKCVAMCFQSLPHWVIIW